MLARDLGGKFRGIRQWQVECQPDGRGLRHGAEVEETRQKVGRSLRGSADHQGRHRQIRPPQEARTLGPEPEGQSPAHPAWPRLAVMTALRLGSGSAAGGARSASRAARISAARSVSARFSGSNRAAITARATSTA